MKKMIKENHNFQPEEIEFKREFTRTFLHHFQLETG